MLNDQTVYEEKIFSSRRMYFLQKYLKSLHKIKQFPDEMYFKQSEDKSTIARDNSQKCEMFNQFFSSVFTPSENINITDCKKSVLNTVLVTEEVISKILLGLDVNKACGPDNLGKIFLKNLPRLSKSLKLVFQTYLNKGVFPEEWKISEVTRIFKENDKADVTQYRPISL